MKEILIDIYTKMENNSAQQFNINQEIFNKLNSESSQNMVALQDVNLRPNRNLNGKIKAIVLAS